MQRFSVNFSHSNHYFHWFSYKIPYKKRTESVGQMFRMSRLDVAMCKPSVEKSYCISWHFNGKTLCRYLARLVICLSVCLFHTWIVVKAKKCQWANLQKSDDWVPNTYTERLRHWTGAFVKRMLKSYRTRDREKVIFWLKQLPIH